MTTKERRSFSFSEYIPFNNPPIHQFLCIWWRSGTLGTFCSTHSPQDGYIKHQDQDQCRWPQKLEGDGPICQSCLSRTSTGINDLFKCETCRVFDQPVSGPRNVEAQITKPGYTNVVTFANSQHRSETEKWSCYRSRDRGIFDAFKWVFIKSQPWAGIVQM